MKPINFFSMLFAITLALTLTLPALPNGSPPPKTETITKETIVKVEMTPVIITAHTLAVTTVNNDVGKITTSKQVKDYNCILPVTEIYLEKPQRPAAVYSTYKERQLCEVTIAIVRPPNKTDRRYQSIKLPLTT